MIYFQQGDCLIKTHEEIKGLTKLDTNLLHKGMSHHHVLEGDFSILEDELKNRFIKTNGCALIHEEHKSILIPLGFYKLENLLEYDHFLEESKSIID